MSWDIGTKARMGVRQMLQGSFWEGQTLRRRCGPTWGSERPPEVHVSEEHRWGLSPLVVKLSEGQADRAGLTRAAATRARAISQSPQACQA